MLQISVNAAPLSKIPPDPVKVIVARVASAFQIGRDDVLGKGRWRHHVAARWIVWRLLRERGWSLPRIGARLGFDHSTVLYGLRRLEATIDAGGVRDPAPLAGDDWRDWRPGSRRIVAPRPLERDPLVPAVGRTTLPTPPEIIQRMASASSFTFQDTASDCGDWHAARRALARLAGRRLISSAQSRRARQAPVRWRLTDAGREWLAAELAKTGAPP